MLRFKKSIDIKFDIKCLTGLHIGGSKDVFEIGGIDNPVIKVPMSFNFQGYKIEDGMPYIPGSSLKGKIRSLLDWKYQTFKIKMKKTKEKKKNGEEEEKIIFYSEYDYFIDFSKKIGLLFGFPAEQSKSFPAGPPRLKFFDAYPTKETIENWKSTFGEGIYTEVKYENQIDRLTSHANPRPIERVPAGSEFSATVIFDIFEIDEKAENIDFYKELFNEKLNNYNLELLKIFLEGLRLLENNFLGGGGSRGSGRVKIENLQIDGKVINLSNYEDKIEKILS